MTSYEEAEDTPTDKAYREAKGRCLCPLQDLPYAKRVLVFLEPSENWGLLFIRTETGLSVFSTRHQERSRDRSGENMSLNHLEYVNESNTLPEALFLFSDFREPAIQIPPEEALAMLAIQVQAMAYKSGWDYRCDNSQINEITRRLKSYVEELLSEHLGIEMGIQILSPHQDERIATAHDLVQRRPLQEVVLKPISAKSPHQRWGEDIEFAIR